MATDAAQRLDDEVDVAARARGRRPRREQVRLDSISTRVFSMADSDVKHC
jgi:hypothetical protein